MEPEHIKHMIENESAFGRKYIEKYQNGQEEHGGQMWTMGAYQLINNAEDEVLDMWSYIRGIRQCLDEIRDAIEGVDEQADELLAYDALDKVNLILSRVKND